MPTPMPADWLRDAVLYEIYPQSFADSNGDGIGDLRGVIDRLDHIASLGVDAIWFNPVFASPFFDAGYDVADYLRVAPRYGTNADLEELIARAGERGIRVILDLVVGHTSIEHPWFQAELHAPGPSPEGDRYIWADELPTDGWDVEMPGIPSWVPSPGPRPGYYLRNFYDEQPALNFGWLETDPAKPWRDATDAPGPRRNREALKEILDFWFSRGVAGFRVDMAFSLVKDLDMIAGLVASTEVWREIRAWLDTAYPDRILIPEGPEPRIGQPLAFDADFELVIFPAHGTLFDNGGAGLMEWHEQVPAYFDEAGQGTLRTFLDAWAQARVDDPDRPVILASADHDFSRLCCGSRTADQLGAAFTFLFTFGTVPCLYYGDEIGLRYLPGLPDVEGSVCNPGYNRAGCRTPMQWDDGPNAGFSTAPPERLYLPIDPAPDRPTVAGQDGVPGSVLTVVRELLALRRATPSLRGHVSTEVLHEGYPFVWLRGGTHLVAVNPGREAVSVELASIGSGSALLASGTSLEDGRLRVEGFGYGVFALEA